MGSAAMDRDGNMAIGFSTSSSSTKPAIKVAGRFANDPLNELRAELMVKQGTGVMNGSHGRWGDYTSMSIDPVSDCTFW